MHEVKSKDLTPYATSVFAGLGISLKVCFPRNMQSLRSLWMKLQSASSPAGWRWGSSRVSPELAVEVACRLVQDRYMLLSRLAHFAYGCVKERMARGLLELGKHYGMRCGEGLLIDLPLSQGDLADLIGASRQKVNLNLREFVNRGLIRADRGRLIILDQNGLQELG